ncbi:hypothetical protein CLIB1423_04S03048 [[Candida] railenensis]|uniref:4a-hydroxytetrahydrobiopterin dehydratase n=1 Tax=[Candida] railenensis TaxID=45579 RepID=A0A9P0QMV9_9ASCO|nr:hypothetical protein CLIB1423_04S03048 [[Candida] railenensis]
MKIPPLSQQLIARSLSELNSSSKKVVWQVTTSPTSHSHLETNLIFKNFGTTWKFLNDVKDYSHKLKHHPTITTTYNKVNLVITTHDVGNSLTDLDFQLAEAIASSSNLDGLK